jgi:hypothetical protein
VPLAARIAVVTERVGIPGVACVIRADRSFWLPHVGADVERAVGRTCAGFPTGRVNRDGSSTAGAEHDRAAIVASVAVRLSGAQHPLDQVVSLT